MPEPQARVVGGHLKEGANQPAGDIVMIIGIARVSASSYRAWGLASKIIVSAPGAAGYIPVAQAIFKTFRIVKHRWAGNDFDIVDVPAGADISLAGNGVCGFEMETDLYILAGVTAQVNGRRGPRATAGIIIGRRYVYPFCCALGQYLDPANIAA